MNGGTIITSISLGSYTSLLGPVLRPVPRGGTTVENEPRSCRFPVPRCLARPWSLLPSPLPSPPEARSDDGRSEGNRSDEPARSGMNGGHGRE